jgi:hypothetical protein
MDEESDQKLVNIIKVKIRKKSEKVKKGNNKITELRTILQRESQNS